MHACCHTVVGIFVNVSNFVSIYVYECTHRLYQQQVLTFAQPDFSIFSLCLNCHVMFCRFCYVNTLYRVCCVVLFILFSISKKVRNFIRTQKILIFSTHSFESKIFIVIQQTNTACGVSDQHQHRKSCSTFENFHNTTRLYSNVEFSSRLYADFYAFYMLTTMSPFSILAS